MKPQWMKISGKLSLDEDDNDISLQVFVSNNHTSVAAAMTNTPVNAITR